VSSQEDLTARARIRDAALQLFTERGIGKATIRDIAAAAGVSSGLVRHHFGSKEALRDACDAYAFDRLKRMGDELIAEGRIAEAGLMADLQPTARLMQDYLVRSMMDGSPAAQKMFDDAVELGERYLAQVDTPDLRAYATMLCAVKVGPFLMRDQISRALGVDVRTPEGHARMMLGFIEVFAHALLTPEQITHAHQALRGIINHPKE
jgi:TetR/AcrR family transcriptional regulator, regulator of cefoperazone and chloramphenicol sensitivity